MLLPPELMRVLLVLSILGMAGLAVSYLAQRKLTPAGYIGWGLLAVLLPLAGPFLVILQHPGEFKPGVRVLPGGKQFLERLLQFGLALLPIEPTHRRRKKLYLIDSLLDITSLSRHRRERRSRKE